MGQRVSFTPMGNTWEEECASDPPVPPEIPDDVFPLHQWETLGMRLCMFPLWMLRGKNTKIRVLRVNGSEAF